MAKGYLYDNGDELITREDVNEVPDSSSAHAGDVLELDSNKKPKWTTPESGLPDTTSASAGDVLSLDEDKDPVWSAPSGGGGGDSVHYVFFNIVTVGTDSRVYLFNMDGSPCSLTDMINSIDSIPILLVYNQSVNGASFSDVSMGIVYGIPDGFGVYEYNDSIYVSITKPQGDSFELTESNNNYVEIPK